MTELKSCAHCGYLAALETMKVRKGYEADMQCLSCPASMHTITYDTEQEAVDAIALAWNTRTPEPQEPRELTLEELQKRIGKPVWVETMNDWRIVIMSHDGENVNLYNAYNTISAKHVLNNDGQIYDSEPRIEEEN